jgi:hypothetical protein
MGRGYGASAVVARHQHSTTRVWVDIRYDDFCRPTRCPRCQRSVYFVRHNGGSVWFDSLGQPWPKHPCFESASGLPDQSDGVDAFELLAEFLSGATQEPDTLLGVVIEGAQKATTAGREYRILCSDRLIRRVLLPPLLGPILLLDRVVGISAQKSEVTFLDSGLTLQFVPLHWP